MDVVRLGPSGNTSYLPDELIEHYTSFIWTERFEDAGDFQLNTPYIEKMQNLLPEGTFISTLQTNEIAVVEDHSIEISEDGTTELVITGRTLDSFTEHRNVRGPYKKKRKMAQEYTPTQAACVLLWNSFDNLSGIDVTRAGSTGWTTKDKVPNTDISNGVAPFDTANSRNWWLRAGPLEDQLRNILLLGDLGIRTIKPNSDEYYKVNVTTGSTNLGDYSHELIVGSPKLRLQIYKGIDRSETVAFNYRHNDFEKAKYFFSNKEHKTGVQILMNSGGNEVFRATGAVDYTGWDRRMMSFDPDEPDEAEFVEEYRIASESDALRELKKHRRTSLFTADISPLASYSFGRDYNLGDTVSLHGEFRGTQKMVVNEYVRTQDHEGDREFPGLALP